MSILHSVIRDCRWILAATVIAARGNAISYGIKTGYDKAFIIDNQTKDALVAADPRSAEILKPVLRGKDIRRYQADWAGKWLIDTHNGYADVRPIDINNYHAIKSHLDRHYDKLKARYDQGITPYNLRSCAYHAEFGKEKLFWIDLTDNGRFAYDDAETFCVNSAYMMTGRSLKYLCAVLNSTLVTWFMRHTALGSGMATPRWIRSTVEQVPIPIIDTADQQPFIRAVNDALKASSPHDGVKTRDSEIDALVNELYGLSDTEAHTITLAG